MLVSVIIPCYNSGHYLEDAVASVMNQTYSGWEIVIVDDGSTDADTLAGLRALEARQDPRIRIIRQRNAGPAAARNTAIAHTTGKYILPLDADDTIEASYMAQAIPVLEHDTGIGIVYCKARKFGLEPIPWELPPFSYEQMAIDNVIFCTAFFRRDDWGAVGGYSEALRHGAEDYDFWLKILKLGRKVYQIGDVLFNYRVHEHSRTFRFRQNTECLVATYATIFRNNIEYFARHAESIYRYRLHLESQCMPQNGVKQMVARMLRCFPFLYRLAKNTYTFMNKRSQP